MYYIIYNPFKKQHEIIREESMIDSYTFVSSHDALTWAIKAFEELTHEVYS